MKLWALLRRDFALWELSVVAWLLLASYFATAHGRLDWTGHGLGRDFVNYWTAGHLVGEGRVADIFNPVRFLARERQLIAPTLPFHFWSYPPPALFLVAPLGLFAYYPGLVVWSVVGVLALLPAVRAWSGDRAERWLIVLAPAVATNIALGQNGAFTAALLIGGLAVMDRRPGWAGVLLGLLVFKPQIAVLLPVMALAGGRWRTIFSAAATALAVPAASVLVFGVETWRGFLGPTLQMQTAMLTQGVGPFRWMMPSAFMAARSLGLSAGWAVVVQAPFTLLAAGLVWMVWRRPASLELRAAVVMMATFVASPQAFNYDLIPAQAAALLLWRRDPSLLGRPLAVVIWTLPVLMMGWQAGHVPVTPLILTAAAVRLAQLALQERRASAAAGPAVGRGRP